MHPPFTPLVTQPEPPARDRTLTAMRWWAAAVIPVMVILPMYVFPIVIGRPIEVYDGRRLIQIVWAGALVGFLLAPRVRAASAAVWSGLPRPVQLGAAVYVLGALLSALLSVAPAYALRGWALMTLLLVVALPLASLLAPLRPKLLELTGLTLVLYGILVFPDPALHGFANPRFQAQVMAVAAPALLFAGNLPLALMAAPGLAVGLTHGSRALVLTLVVVTVLGSSLWPERRRRVLPALAGLALAALLLGVLADRGYEPEMDRPLLEREDSEEPTSVVSRLDLWQATLARFLDAPVLGIGPDLLARAPGIGFEAGAHPHNAVLMIAAETGLVGLLGIGMIVLTALARVLRVDPARRPWALALLGGGFDSLLSGTIVTPASQTMFLLALALVLPATPSDTPPRSRARTGWVLLGLGAAAFVIILLTLDLPSERVTGPFFRPRFFESGITP